MNLQQTIEKFEEFLKEDANDVKENSTACQYFYVHNGKVVRPDCVIGHFITWLGLKPEPILEFASEYDVADLPFGTYNNCAIDGLEEVFIDGYGFEPAAADFLFQVQKRCDHPGSQVGDPWGKAFKEVLNPSEPDEDW